MQTADIERALERIGHERPSGRAAYDSPGLRATVEQHGGNLSAAARALGIPRSTLRDRVRTES